jgi:hypothetical protein
MLSWKTQTTLFVLSFYHPFSLINVKAEWRTAPEEPPTNRPYCLTRSLAVRSELTSSVLTQ